MTEITAKNLKGVAETLLVPLYIRAGDISEVINQDLSSVAEG